MGCRVMMDGTFNHSSPDAIIGQGAVDLGITADGTQQIRAFNPGWYAKEGSPATPAANAAEIAIAPDRNDFGNWTDVREFYFGDYDALVKEKGTPFLNAEGKQQYPDNAYKLAFLLERDEFAGHTATTRQVWNYFAHYPIYWLEKSGHTASTPKNQSHIGIDGLRCDFAQGLPSQFWEYAINKTRSRKWDFVFMAESLDGAREVAGSKRHGVGYRSARHFDVLNENIVFYWRDTFYGYPANGGAGEIKNPKTYDTWKAYDDRRNAFDNVTLLNNLTSHDEIFPTTMSGPSPMDMPRWELWTAFQCSCTARKPGPKIAKQHTGQARPILGLLIRSIRSRNMRRISGRTFPTSKSTTTWPRSGTTGQPMSGSSKLSTAE